MPHGKLLFSQISAYLAYSQHCSSLVLLLVIFKWKINFAFSSSKLSPGIGADKSGPHPQVSFPGGRFGRGRCEGDWGKTLMGMQSWLLSEPGPACVKPMMLSCPKASDSVPKMPAWGKPGSFCFTRQCTGAEGLYLLRAMEQGSVWDLHVTTPGCARSGRGSPRTRSTGDGASSGGAKGTVQNRGEKSTLLHQVRGGERWKSI